MTAEGAALSELRMVAAGLRGWAAVMEQDGQPFARPAVELVVRARGGEFADPGWPWVREAGALGLFWLDTDAMTGWDGGRPEHPVMDFVEALAGGRPVRQLAELLRVLEQPTRRLVLTAFHHAAAADPVVAVYAFGGDPWQLVGDAPAAWRFWPVDELDRLDRPAPVMRPRLKVAGGAR